MGLLDDAIREHLELKRQRGADEAEVRRQEDEALGPARRQPAPPAEADEAAGAAPEQQPEPALADEPEGPATVAADRFEGPTEPGRSEPDDEPWLEEPDEVPAEEALEHSTTSQPTAEFTPEDVEAVDPDEEPAEDVLEETPEFLQETPEHDRLWFEQKPPRDFDFDQ